MDYVRIGDCTENYSTISESFSLAGGTVAVTVKCPWTKRHDVLMMLLDGEGHNPEKFPEQDSIAPYCKDLRVQDVRIEPMQSHYTQGDGEYGPDGTGQSIEYEYAFVTITYSLLYTEITQDSTLEYLSVNAGNMFWRLNGDDTLITPEEAPGFRLPTFDLTLSHPYMSLSCGNGTQLTEFDGCCNQYAISIKHMGFERSFEPETLLCSSPSIKTCPNIMGTKMHSVTLKLSYNPIGHNEWFHPLQSGSSLLEKRVKMYDDTNTRIKPIPTKDFVDLFNAFHIQEVTSDNGN